MIDLLSSKFKANILVLLKTRAYDALKKWHQSGKYLKSKTKRKNSFILDEFFTLWKKRAKFSSCLKNIFHKKETESFIFSFYQIKRFFFIKGRMCEKENALNIFLTKKYFQKLKFLILEKKKNRLNNGKTTGIFSK